jgi:hypothetical protein
MKERTPGRPRAALGQIQVLRYYDRSALFGILKNRNCLAKLLKSGT